MYKFYQGQPPYEKEWAIWKILKQSGSLVKCKLVINFNGKSGYESELESEWVDEFITLTEDELKVKKLELL